MRLNAYIESLTSIFFGQIFDMKKSLQENINQLEIAITSNLRGTELNTPDQKTRWRLPSLKLCQKKRKH